jgi:hypothetical protein
MRIAAHGMFEPIACKATPRNQNWLPDVLLHQTPCASLCPYNLLLHSLKIPNRALTNLGLALSQICTRPSELRIAPSQISTRPLK